MPFTKHQNPLHFHPPATQAYSEGWDRIYGKKQTSTDTEKMSETKKTKNSEQPVVAKAEVVDSTAPTTEVVKRKPGRPPGAKNKPKVPAPEVIAPVTGVETTATADTSV